MPRRTLRRTLQDSLAAVKMMRKVLLKHPEAEFGTLDHNNDYAMTKVCIDLEHTEDDIQTLLKELID